MFADATEPLFTVSQFVPMAIFGAFAAAAWVALEYMAKGKPRALERLDEIRIRRSAARPGRSGP